MGKKGAGWGGGEQNEKEKTVNVDFAIRHPSSVCTPRVIMQYLSTGAASRVYLQATSTVVGNLYAFFVALVIKSSNMRARI